MGIIAEPSPTCSLLDSNNEMNCDKDLLLGILHQQPADLSLFSVSFCIKNISLSLKSLSAGGSFRTSIPVRTNACQHAALSYFP